MDFETFVDKHKINHRLLKVGMNMSLATFSNKLSRKRGQYFTEDEYPILLNNIESQGKSLLRFVAAHKECGSQVKQIDKQAMKN